MRFDAIIDDAIVKVGNTEYAPCFHDDVNGSTLYTIKASENGGDWLRFGSMWSSAENIDELKTAVKNWLSEVQL